MLTGLGARAGGLARGGAALRCLKSSSNYGRLAQQQLRYAEYRDATCSGAETEDMTVKAMADLVVAATRG